MSVVEDKMKEVFDKHKVPTSNPFFFDVIESIDDILKCIILDIRAAESDSECKGDYIYYEEDYIYDTALEQAAGIIRKYISKGEDE